MDIAEETGCPRPNVFQECWASCNNGLKVVVQKHLKARGEAEECHCYNSSIILMLVCLLLFVSCFLLLFFFSIRRNNLSMDGISYYIVCLCLCLFVHIDL